MAGRKPVTDHEFVLLTSASRLQPQPDPRKDNEMPRALVTDTQRLSRTDFPRAILAKRCPTEK